MECNLCGFVKLPNEFPPENVTEGCRHPLLVCLRCTIDVISKTSKCPVTTCEQAVKITDDKPKFFQAILNQMFQEYEEDEIEEEEYDMKSNNSLSASGTLTVTVLTGKSITILFDPKMEVLALKQKVKEKLGHAVDKQKLLYNGRELQIHIQGRSAVLSDYSLKPYSTISLVVLLFAIPDNFDHVVFDLFWGYPSTGVDFLDASCLVFRGEEYVGVADWRRRSGKGSLPIADWWRFSGKGSLPGISHSGDIMDSKRRQGHHIINVELQKLDSTFTHVVFTLSAWGSPDILRYPSPSLRFYEAANPEKNLCGTTFTHAQHSRAVIMCVMSRDLNAAWKIFESGKLSAGNAMNYDPIITTIKDLIKQGF